MLVNGHVDLRFLILTGSHPGWVLHQAFRMRLINFGVTLSGVSYWCQDAAELWASGRAAVVLC